MLTWFKLIAEKSSTGCLLIKIVCFFLKTFVSMSLECWLDAYLPAKFGIASDRLVSTRMLPWWRKHCQQYPWSPAEFIPRFRTRKNKIFAYMFASGPLSCAEKLNPGTRTFLILCTHVENLYSVALLVVQYVQNYRSRGFGVFASLAWVLLLFKENENYTYLF
jgi:hypothetical protein